MVRFLLIIAFRINLAQKLKKECDYVFITYFRLSISSDLKFDAERDLRDIGATNIKVNLNIIYGYK